MMVKQTQTLLSWKFHFSEVWGVPTQANTAKKLTITNKISMTG